jgi:1,2-phenylacetyl-CoA epoxidase catalytic subunit
MAERDGALRALLLRLADNEYTLGLRYAEWRARAPQQDATLMVELMAQQEWTHARALAALLASDDAQFTLFERPESGCIAFLRAPLRDWVDLVAVNFLFDGALSVVCTAAVDSADATFASVMRSILRDETQHTAFAISWVKRLAGEGGPTRDGIEAAIRRIWDATMCWFGPQDDPTAHALYDRHLLDAMPDVLRARLLSHIGPVARATRVRLPLRPAPHGNAWVLATPLPWSRWNAAAWQLDPPEALP